jgi:Holliday junction DNA helicase RuvB
MVRERKIGPNDEEDRDDQGLGSKGPRRADETIDDPDSDQADKPTTDKGLGLGSTRSENDAVLRPKRIDEMIGQREVMEVLKIAIDAANKREDPLGHILLDGPPGLGKTTFAVCIPQELGVHVEMASGPSLKAPKEILPYLTNLQRRSVLFIDEIHRLPKPVEEFLYTAMEDFRVDIVLGEGVNARTLNLKLQPFTLIGATTRAGMLSGPLRDRFHIRQHLSYYNEEDLVKILERNAEKMLGIDELGLDRQDRKYLETISRVFQGGPAGLEAIAHTMGVSSDTLEDEVEPFLLRSEMIIRTQRGRMITGIGLKIGNAKG